MFKWATGKTKEGEVEEKRETRKGAAQVKGRETADRCGREQLLKKKNGGRERNLDEKQQRELATRPEIG